MPVYGLISLRTIDLRVTDWITMLRRASVARVNTRLQRYVGQLPNRTAALLIYYSSLSSFEFDTV